METISELRKKLKKLEKEEHKLHKQQRDVYNAIEALKTEQFMRKVNKHLKVGDIRIKLLTQVLSIFIVRL